MDQDLTVLLPVVATGAQCLEFREWKFSEPLKPDAHDIPAPSVHAAIRIPRTILVPLLAVDQSGHRLGYGGGYYDRTIRELRRSGRILALGVSFDGQKVDRLPHDVNDQPLDGVVTETGISMFVHEEVE